MNCSTRHYELSLCLDGRLPSGRRTVVMQHVATCDGCSMFWNELQAAQQLTLQLPHARMSESFQEELWERVRAGEGTPDAVFHEPVPLLAKLRYTLTGAAAAAAALLCLTWLRDDRQPNDPRPNDRQSEERSVADLAPSQDERPRTSASNASTGSGALASAAFDSRLDLIEQTPLFASMQRLRFSTLAVETAKQLEQRYASASGALGRINEEGALGEVAVRQVLENADELRSFGELLLDLSRGDWLFFTDAKVGADLRLAVDMLGQVREGQIREGWAREGLAREGLAGEGQARDQVSHRDTIRSFVAPALRTAQLANVSRSIGLKPPLDARLEMDVLARLNRQRPEVFPKLFIVFGTDDAICEQFGLFRNGTAFVMEGQCGPSWVAPRSEVEARDNMLRTMRQRRAGGGLGGAPGSAPVSGQRIEVQIQIQADEQNPR
ncbi:MAG: hypothetical protein ABIP94_23805 [Planctomycetota bacterium]